MLQGGDQGSLSTWATASLPETRASITVTLTFWLYLRIPRVRVQDSPGGARYNPPD